MHWVGYKYMIITGSSINIMFSFVTFKAFYKKAIIFPLIVYQKIFTSLILDSIATKDSSFKLNMN